MRRRKSLRTPQSPRPTVTSLSQSNTCPAWPLCFSHPTHDLPTQYLVGIGCQKCGTTSMAEYLSLVEWAFMSRHKGEALGPKNGAMPGRRMSSRRGSCQGGDSRRVDEAAVLLTEHDHIISVLASEVHFFEMEAHALPSSLEARKQQREQQGLPAEDAVGCGHRHLGENVSLRVSTHSQRPGTALETEQPRLTPCLGFCHLRRRMYTWSGANNTTAGGRRLPRARCPLRFHRRTCTTVGHPTL